MKKSDPPIIVEQTFNKPINTVWATITEQQQMVQWFFKEIPEFKAEVGFETQFNIHVNERDFLHQWKIIEVIPNQKITYDWSYDVYSGIGHVTFELSEDEDKTKLTLTNIVVQDFPQDIPEFKRESCIEGWEYFIQNSLKEYLEAS